MQIVLFIFIWCFLNATQIQITMRQNLISWYPYILYLNANQLTRIAL